MAVMIRMLWEGIWLFGRYSVSDGILLNESKWRITYARSTVR